MTATDELLSDAVFLLITNPTLSLLDAVDRWRRLMAGDTTPYDEYGSPNTLDGWSNALLRAESDVAELVQEAKAVVA